MVEWDQPVVDVCVTTRGQRARMLKADMPTKKFPKEEVNPTKGH
jgi:hypothetical protein